MRLLGAGAAATGHEAVSNARLREIVGRQFTEHFVADEHAIDMEDPEFWAKVLTAQHADDAELVADATAPEPAGQITVHTGAASSRHQATACCV